MSEKFILYLDGGAMSGIFGGGVIATFEDLNIYPYVEAVYAASAGAFNAAYFLAHQTDEGAVIYLDYLSKGFISSKNFVKGIPQRFYNAYVKEIPKEQALNAIDIDYVVNIIRHLVPLNLAAIKKQNIPFYIKVLNIKTGKDKYFLATDENIFDLLKASSCVVPYTFESVLINGERFIDGTLLNPIGLKKLIEKYPNRKIVIVSNRRGNSKFRHKVKAFLEGVVTNTMYGKKFYDMHLKREELGDQDFEFARKNPNVLLIHAPDDCPVRPSTRDRKTIKIAMEMGMKEGLRIKEFLGI